ncbi:hypothetical protein D3C79_1015010 [compost metagenome]
MGLGLMVCMSTSGLPLSLAGCCCMPAIIEWSMPAIWLWSMAPMSAMAPWPISAIDRIGRGSGSGTSALRPLRRARVPRA